MAFNAGDSYNAMTKDSTLLARQVTGDLGANKVKGVKALNNTIDGMADVMREMFLR